MLVEDANRRPAPIARRGGRGTLCETTKPARPETWKDAIPKGWCRGTSFIARSGRPLVVVARRKCERTRRRTMAAVRERDVCIQKWGVMLSRLPLRM
jgi:hypothetical protein